MWKMFAPASPRARSTGRDTRTFAKLLTARFLKLTRHPTASLDRPSLEASVLQLQRMVCLLVITWAGCEGAGWTWTGAILVFIFGRGKL